MSQRVFENDFTMLVGILPYGTDPSLNNLATGQPAKLRTTMTMGNSFVTGEASTVNAVSAGYANQTGTIEVLDLDFTTGRCVLVLGENEIVSGLHYLAGGSLALTAANIGVVLARLPGFTVSVVGAVITVGYVSDVNADVPFHVHHYGTIQNLSLTPSDGHLTHGTPALGAPRIL